MVDLTAKFRFMAIATFVAYRALRNGETPVACIFVHEPTQKILSFGCNDTNRSLNGTRHAEFVAIDKILEENNLLGKSPDIITNFFTEVTLYVTVEPCVMCALAIKQLGVGKVYFGAANDRFGGNGTVIKIQEEDSYQSYGGIMRVEAIQLLRDFYTQENDTAPVPKVKKNKDIHGKSFPPNLDFEKYLARDRFIEEYGDVRYENFYLGRNPHQEITPTLYKGYELEQLLSESDLRTLPNVSDLYPSSEMDLENDIHHLNALLPLIGDDGVIIFDKESLKCRKRIVHDQ